MLSIQVVMSLLRDVRMREQAHIIQQEVVKLVDDVARLDDRVRKLQLHFNQANKDIEDILVSSRKVTGRGERIRTVDVEDGEPPAQPAVAPGIQPARQRSGSPELPFSQFEEV
jgi:DNA recombination protein RmuC